MKGTCIVLMVAGALVAAPVEAQSESDLLHDRLDDLAARIAEYKAEHTGGGGGGAWLTEARAAEVRGLVQDVLEDADTRASLLQDGATAGWDGHPFLASADGNYFLQIEGRFQWRYVFNRQDDQPGVDDTSRGSFENRRIRYIFSGHVVDPSITYKLQATHDRNGGALDLEDAYMQKEWENGAYVRAGQSRPPFTREVNVSTFRTTAVERSIAHGAIELSRTQGVEVGWRDNRLGVRGMFHDGDDRANTPALMEDTEYAVSARGEWIIAGEWSQFNDFTSWKDGEFGVLVGAGGHFERGEFGTATSEYEDWRWTVDGSGEFGGCGLYAAVGGRKVDQDGADDIDILIGVLQGEIFLTDTCEAFGRLEWGDDDSVDDLVIITAGATRFWKKHDLKWTTDVGYAFEGVTGTFASSGAGWREDPPGADGQIVVRSQVQLAF